MPGAVQRQDRAGAPVDRASQLERAWGSDHAHVAGWFVLSATLLLVYLGSHYLLRPQFLRSAAVAESIATTAHLYHVAESPETGRLELTLEGQPAPLRPAASSRHGIGPLSPARGLLAEAQSRLAVYDRRLAAYLGDLLASFTRVEGRGAVMQAPLQRFAGRGFEAEDGQVVRIDTGSLRPLVDLAANEAGARRFLRLLARAQVFDLNIAAPASGAGRAGSAVAPGALLPGVRESLEQIQRDAAQRRLRLGSRRLARPTAIEIVDAVCDELADLRAPIEDFFGGAVGDVPGCAPLLPAGRRASGDPFHVRLSNLLLSEVGFFWTFGPWLWLEVVLLSWLGVLTECLTRLGVRYSGADPDGQRWEPRESGRTLLKLAYAPAIAMVAIWTLMSIGWIETEVRLSEGGIAGFVPIAFAVGLFPNLGYALLERLVRAVFYETSVARPRPKPGRTIKTETGTRPTPVGQAPDFASVRERIARHGSAPLRGD